MQTLDYRGNAKRSDWQIVFAVLFLHAGLYALWPVLKENINEGKQKSGSLIFLDLPAPAKTPVLHMDKKEVARQKQAQAQFQPQSVPIGDSTNTATELQPEPMLPAPGKETESQANVVINRDVKGIYQGLKKDFQERERFASKVSTNPITRMGERIALSGTVNRVGVKHEVYILGNGRPVSKVITPFGTYCILHRKPGEIIGNELATVPVTCDNL